MYKDDIQVDSVRKLKVENPMGFAQKWVERVESVLESDWWRIKEHMNRSSIRMHNSAMKPDNQQDFSPDECRIDTPTYKTLYVMAAARMINAVFSTEKLFSGRPTRPTEGGQKDPLVRDFESLAEYICYNNGYAKYREYVKFAIASFLTFRKSVTRIGWEETKKKIRDYYCIINPDGDMGKDGENTDWMWGVHGSIGEDGIPRIDYQGKIRKKIREVKIGNGGRTTRHVIPCNDLIYPPCDTNDWQEMPWVTHRFYRSIDWVEKQVREGKFPKEIDGKSTVKRLVGAEGEGPDMSLRLEVYDEFEDGSDVRSPSFIGSDIVDGRIEFFNIFTTGKDGIEHEYLIARNGAIPILLTENYRDDYYRPFSGCSYEPVDGSVDGGSMAFDIEPIHQMISASVRSRITAASLANGPCVLLDEDLDASKYFVGGRPTIGFHSVTKPMSGGKLSDFVHEVKLTQGYTQLPQLEEYLNRYAQILVGLNDYNAGQEQVDRPTALGQQLLIQEGAQPWLDRIESFRAMLSEVLYQEISLVKQHFPESLKTYFDNGVNSVQLQINWPTEYWQNRVILETSVSSQKLSKELRRQEWVAMIQQLPQIFNGLMEFANMATSGGPVQKVSRTLINYLITSVLTPYLESFNMTSPEMLSEQIERDINEGADFAQILQQMQQQMEQLAQENQAAVESNQKLGGLLSAAAGEYRDRTGEIPAAFEKAKAEAAFGAAG